MRVVGAILIVFGLILCLTIIGIGFGIVLILIGAVLVAIGGRRKIVIHNTVTVANTLPGSRSFQPEFQLQKPESLASAPLQRMPTTPVLSAPVATYDRVKWQTLVRYDDELREAAAKVRAYGGRWEDELAQEYLSINDKEYLQKIVARIIGDAMRA